MMRRDIWAIYKHVIQDDEGYLGNIQEVTRYLGNIQARDTRWWGWIFGQYTSTWYKMTRRDIWAIYKHVIQDDEEGYLGNIQSHDTGWWGILGQYTSTWYKMMRRDIRAIYKHVIRDDEKDIWAIYKHMIWDDELSLDEQYQNCPQGEESWCTYWTDHYNGTKTYDDATRLPSVFLNELKQLFTWWSNDDLSNRCLMGITQNENESINVLWCICLKTKFCGLQKVIIICFTGDHKI